MRDPARIDRILAKLRAYWKAYPDLRLAQIVVNATGKHGTSADIFHTEDDVVEKQLDDTLERLDHETP